MKVHEVLWISVMSDTLTFTQFFPGGQLHLINMKNVTCYSDIIQNSVQYPVQGRKSWQCKILKKHTLLDLSLISTVRNWIKTDKQIFHYSKLSRTWSCFLSLFLNITYFIYPIKTPTRRKDITVQICSASFKTTLLFWADTQHWNCKNIIILHQSYRDRGRNGAPWWGEIC